MGIPQRWVIILSGAFFYLYQAILRVSPNVMSDSWMLHFKMDADSYGLMTSFYYWSYAGIQIPLGLMLDRIGVGRLMVVAAFLCSLSCFILISTDSMTVGCVSLFLLGLGSACAFLGSVKLGTLWFSPNDLAKVVALVIVFGALGFAIGGTPLSMLILAYDWQYGIQLLGIMGLLVTLFLYFSVGRVQDPKPKDLEEGELEPESPHTMEGIKLVLSNPQVWLIALYGMFMYSPIIIYGAAWGVPFVKATSYTTDATAALVITSMVLGAAIGSPVFAYFSDKMHRRVQPMFVGVFIGFLLQLGIVFVPGIPLTLLYGLFFFVGFCYTAKALSFTAVCEIIPKTYSGVAVGFVNTLTMGAGTILHPLIGKLLVFHWDGTTLEGARIYTEGDYRFAMIVIPTCLAIALILIKFIRETHHAAPKEKNSSGSSGGTAKKTLSQVTKLVDIRSKTNHSYDDTTDILPIPAQAATKDTL